MALALGSPPCRWYIASGGSACRDGAIAADRPIHIDPTLPYELLALESALAAYHRELDTETFDLESLAGPSLERLALKARLKGALKICPEMMV